MAREFAKAFYNSQKWKRCRDAYIKMRKRIDGGMCESCHEVPGYIVHHKIELNPENISDPEIALNFSNLKYDCHICHNKEGMKGDDVPGMICYGFTDEGEVVELPP
ncbi:MAG: hypothetical protein SOY12_00590 [Schaedlerella sp.]|nr:hypothetical protein [Lachnospiraceae bacterium]MDY4201557.1 hypothetical protein [Schaedlerella sp.]